MCQTWVQNEPSERTWIRLSSEDGAREILHFLTLNICTPTPRMNLMYGSGRVGIDRIPPNLVCFLLLRHFHTPATPVSHPAPVWWVGQASRLSILRLMNGCSRWFVIFEDSRKMSVMNCSRPEPPPLFNTTIAIMLHFPALKKVKCDQYVFDSYTLWRSSLTFCELPATPK